MYMYMIISEYTVVQGSGLQKPYFILYQVHSFNFNKQSLLRFYKKRFAFK